MKFLYKYIVTAVLFFCACLTQAQTGDAFQTSGKSNFFNTDMDYQVQAFFSIGGSTPVGFPASIRKIEHFNPALQLGLAANATKWLDDDKQWGIRIGLQVEGKGMKTQARVEKYLTEIIRDNSSIGGYYYGRVNTDVKNTYVTVPVSVVYRLAGRWNVFAGLYASTAIDREFRGHVSDGYLRQETPIGSKISFEDGSQAEFNFSDDERIFQWGTQAGAEYFFNQHFHLFSNLTYGASNLFKKDFPSISFAMHNLYLNTGFGYRF